MILSYRRATETNQTSKIENNRASTESGGRLLDQSLVESLISLDNLDLAYFLQALLISVAIHCTKGACDSQHLHPWSPPGEKAALYRSQREKT